MHFVLRMLHTQLQRQVRRPETDRPRVALLADEAHYLASRRERRRPDRHPPRRRPRRHVRPAVLRAARLGLRAPGEDPQGHHQPAAEPVPVPARRPRGRRRGHADRDGRLLDDDPRRPRLARAHARHARAGAQPPRPLLPRLLDRRRLPRRQLHRPDLPVPDSASPTRGRGSISSASPRRSAPTRRRWPRRSSACPPPTRRLHRSSASPGPPLSEPDPRQERRQNSHRRTRSASDRATSRVRDDRAEETPRTVPPPAARSARTSNRAPGVTAPSPRAEPQLSVMQRLRSEQTVPSPVRRVVGTPRAERGGARAARARRR